MAGTFSFELVSPERLLVSEQVEQVVAPGSEGEFTVLAGHAPFLTTLKPGIVRVTTGTTTRSLFVRGGFAEVNPAGVTILADQAIAVEDLDAARFAAEIAAAEAEVAAAHGEDARQRAQDKLDRIRELRASLTGEAAATVH